MDLSIPIYPFDAYTDDSAAICGSRLFQGTTTSIASGESNSLIDTGHATIVDGGATVTLEVTTPEDIAVGQHTVSVTSGFSLYPSAATATIDLWPIDIVFDVISCALLDTDWDYQGTAPVSDGANNFDVDFETFNDYKLNASASFRDVTPC